VAGISLRDSRVTPTRRIGALTKARERDIASGFRDVDWTGDPGYYMRFLERASGVEQLRQRLQTAIVSTPGGTVMPAEDNAAVARAWARAAFIEHDLDAAAAFLAPDWVGHWAGLGEGRGIEGFKRPASAYLAAFLDPRITVENALAVGDRVVRRISLTATHRGPFLGIPPTGRRVQAQGTVVMRIVDGRIAEEWECSDLLGLLQQLGAVPRFPSPLDSPPA
jgi:predicted ester cyclase